MSAGLLSAFGTPVGEIAGAGIVLAACVACIAIAEWWHRRAGPPTEWTRKFIHFGLGMSAMAYPWLLSSHWTLLALVVLGGVALLWARARGWLPSLFAVERRSHGEVYFPIAVYLLFALGRHQPVFYFISLFTLVVCDALAAVLGKAYGRHQYLVTSDRRSLEGSAVFLFTAFLGVLIPLLLLTELERGICIVVAVQLALLVASFEAIGTGGSDNLLVPVATYYLLLKLTPRTVEQLGLQLAAQLGILGVLWLVARTTRFLTFSGVIAAHLVLYAAFSLGGPAWLVAPALALVAAFALESRVVRALGLPLGGHHVRIIFYVSIVAVLLLFADNTFATLVPNAGGLRVGHPFHTPFVASLAAALGILAFWAFESTPRLRWRTLGYRALASASLGYFVVVPLGLFVQRGDRAGSGDYAIAALVCAGALLAFLAARRWSRCSPGSLWDLRFLALGVFLATVVLLPLHFVWAGVSGWWLE